MIEKLYQIPDFPWYGITMNGEVYSVKFKRWLKPQRDNRNRLQVTLRRNNKSYTRKVANLLQSALDNEGG